VKKFFWATFFIFLFLILFQIDFKKFSATPGCAFCNEKVLEKQSVFQGKNCQILATNKPVVAGHLLVIAKRHVERFEDLKEEEMVEMLALIRKINSVAHTGYLILQKNGKEAGQSVPHVHIHYIPREQGDSGLWLAFRLLTRHWFKPVHAEEMHNTITPLQISMTSS